MRIGVIASVGIELLWLSLWSATFAAYVGKFFDKRQKLSDIVPVGPGDDNGQGSSIGIGNHVMLYSQFPSVDGIWACFAPSAGSPDRRTVDYGVLHVKLSFATKFGQEKLAQSFPNASSMPFESP